MEARAAEQKQEPTLAGREEQGDVLAQRARGSSEWIYFLPLERDLSTHRNPCVWSAPGDTAPEGPGG